MACKPIEILAVVVFLATFLANHEVRCQPPSPTFRFALCQNDLFGSYTANSTYEANLATMLADLIVNAPTEPFHNSSSGGAVFGQYYCRGDITPQFCSLCVQLASGAAFNCSNAKAAIVWFEECTLRYSNESMYGVASYLNPTTLASYSLNNMSGDPVSFSEVLNKTVSGLIQEAALQPRYFATENVTDTTSLETTYFLVQCSPDLSVAQCQSCLAVAFNRTQRCCGHWPIYIYSFPPNCQVMYDTRGPFSSTSDASPASPPPPTSPSSPTSLSSQPPPANQVTVLDSPPSASTPPTTGGSVMTRSGESLKLGIVSILLAFMLS